MTVTSTPGTDAHRAGVAEAAAIDVRGLAMRYGSRDVLAGVELSVARGEVVALLGANGAGKTTAIEILEGFRVRSAGHVRVLGVDPAEAPEAWRARVGIVLQSWRDHGKWTVRELLEHLGRYYVPFSVRLRELDELISMVGLEERDRTAIARLSGGERRRLDLAIGIVGRPEVLFLDEPTNGLDPVARREFHDLVHRLSDLEDTTILLTTHDLDEAEKLADRILILDHGTIVADGSAEALARRVSGRAEVRWSRDGEHFVHATSDATGFVRELLTQPGSEVADLEVRRASLEDTYMTIVARREQGRQRRALVEIEELAP